MAPGIVYMPSQWPKEDTGKLPMGREVNMDRLHPKMARVNELLERGFEVDDITSDHGTVDIHLRRKGLLTTVQITRREAAELLFGRAIPEKRVVTIA